MIETGLYALEFIVTNFHFVLMGVAIGMVVGIIPGMGGSVALALLIPLTLTLQPERAFILYGSALGATSFSGALTAILVNTPGSGSNAATLLDGFPMTRGGRAREAIGAASSASALGATIGLGVFLLSIPLLREVALFFGTVEIFWLAVFGIAIIPAVTPGSMVKGLIGGGLGMLVAFHGLTVHTGEFRYTYVQSLPGVIDIGLIPALVGVFAIGEMLHLATKDEPIKKKNVELAGTRGDLWKGVMAPIKNYSITIRGSLFGIFVGAIPGIGGTVAGLMSYAHVAQLSSRDGDVPFGEGNVKGVIASESANDSKDGGQLIPTLGLGIPGSGSTAILLGALLVHGFWPGPDLIRTHLLVVYLLLFSLFFSNVLTSIIGLGISGYVVKISEVEIPYMFPAIITFALAATFLVNNAYGDVILAFIFGLVGFVFIQLSISRIPLVIAIVLAVLAEEHFHRTMQLGDFPLIFFSSPVAILLAAVVTITLLMPIIKYASTWRATP